MEKLSSSNEKRVEIREIGSYFETDENGYLVNPASAEKISEEWRPVVEDVINAYKAQYGDALHSVYVRGSVAKGEAVVGISDLDTFAYVSLPREQITLDWRDAFRAAEQKKYPFAAEIELEVDPIEAAKEDRLFILQSACVYGEDLGASMAKLKAGEDTLGHVYSFAKSLDRFDEWAAKPEEPDEIRKACTWLMKRLLRTGFELTMTRAHLYTRDLYPSFKTFSAYYPEKEGEMREALELALNPIEDLDRIQRIRRDLGNWLKDESKQYLKE